MHRWPEIFLAGCSSALEGINSISKYGRIAGKAAPYIGGIIGAYKVYEGYQKDGGRFGANAINGAVTSAGSVAGGWAGAEGGAALGAAIGVWFGGIGAVPGAIIGGFIGGIMGSIAGEKIGDAIAPEPKK